MSAADRTIQTMECEMSNLRDALQASQAREQRLAKALSKIAFECDKAHIWDGQRKVAPEGVIKIMHMADEAKKNVG